MDKAINAATPNKIGTNNTAKRPLRRCLDLRLARLNVIKPLMNPAAAATRNISAKASRT